MEEAGESQTDGEGLAFSGNSKRRRSAWGAGLQLEQFLVEDSIHIVPALRVDAINSYFSVPEGEGEVADEGEDQQLSAITPRIAARMEVVPGLELRSSVGRYFRAPTLLELFGDRGYVIGNEGLRAESGLNVDGGIVWDDGFSWFSRPSTIHLQAAGFASWSEDWIQWIQAGSVIRPENIQSVENYGVEAGLDMSFVDQFLKLQLNYTFLVSRNESPDPEQFGKPLPGRVPHELFLGTSIGWRWFPHNTELGARIFYNLDFLSSVTLDPSARYRLPPRLIQGIGVSFDVARRIDFAFEVRNFTNQRVTVWDPGYSPVGPIPQAISDFIGYPLPGASAWATLAFHFNWPKK